MEFQLCWTWMDFRQFSWTSLHVQLLFQQRSTGTRESATKDTDTSTTTPTQSEGDDSTSNGESKTDMELETVAFNVIFNKQKHEVTFPLDHSVLLLKQHLEKITSE